MVCGVLCVVVCNVSLLMEIVPISSILTYVLSLLSGSGEEDEDENEDQEVQGENNETMSNSFLL